MGKSKSVLELNVAFKNKAARKKREQFNKDFQQQASTQQSTFLSSETLTKKAAYIRWKALENLEVLLSDFEAKARLNGFAVHWAPDAETAKDQIVSISTKGKIKRITQTGWLTLNELNLQDALAELNVDIVTTDSSNYVNSVNKQAPGHPLFGAYNLSEKDINNTLTDRSRSGLKDDRTEQHETILETLGAKYKIADAHLVSANFLFADTGDISIVDTDGSGLKGMNNSKTTIVLAGIDAIIPSISHLELFTHIYSLYGTSQSSPVYSRLIRRSRESAQQNVHIILIDNGRSEKLEDPDYRSLLQCINCGACYQVCPLVQTAGSAENTFKQGPMGLAKTRVGHSSLLCEKCTSVCPVHVPIHKLLLQNKQRLKEKLSATKKKGMYYFFWKQTMMNRDIMNLGGLKTRRQINKKLFSPWWGSQSNIPETKTQSFNEAWRDKYGDT